MPRRLACICLLLSFSASLNAQTTAQTSVLKDSTAVSIAQRSFAAMGGSNLASYQDLTANGTITFPAGSTGVNASYPLVLKAKGTRELRSETSKPNGAQVWATDGNQGCMSYGAIQRPVAFENLLAQRVDFFPVLSLLAEYANNNMNVQNAGTTTINGHPAYAIALSFTPAAASIPVAQAVALTQRIFYIDQQSYVVVKMQFTRYADNAPGSGFMSEMYFSGYQNSNGFLLPTRIDSYFNFKQVSTVSLTTFSFNTGLLDSQFAMTCGGSYDN